MSRVFRPEHFCIFMGTAQCVSYNMFNAIGEFGCFEYSILSLNLGIREHLRGLMLCSIRLLSGQDGRDGQGGLQ